MLAGVVVVEAIAMAMIMVMFGLRSRVVIHDVMVYLHLKVVLIGVKTMVVIVAIACVARIIRVRVITVASLPVGVLILGIPSITENPSVIVSSPIIVPLCCGDLTFGTES